MKINTDSMTRTSRTLLGGSVIRNLKTTYLTGIQNFFYDAESVCEFRAPCWVNFDEKNRDSKVRVLEP